MEVSVDFLGPFSFTYINPQKPKRVQSKVLVTSKVLQQFIPALKERECFVVSVFMQDGSITLIPPKKNKRLRA